MGPDSDFKGELLTVMDVSPSKEGRSAKMSENQKTSASLSEDNNFNIEALPNESAKVYHRSEDTVINVTDLIDSDDKDPVVSESEKLTESSSSFSDTDSGTDNGALSNGIGVKSELYDDGTSMHPFDRFSDLLMSKKKRLTPHWRSFIRPLMWRLKWTELKIKILEAEAAKYGKKMAGHGLRKEHELRESTTEEHSVKCSPIPCQNQRVKVMKRRKRKCADETNDIFSYMSQHHLFSYHVSKKSSAGGAHSDSLFATPEKQEIPIKFNMEELDSNGGWRCLESKDDEMLEDILEKIELAKLQLDALKVRADKVASENAGRICASERLGLVASQSSLRTCENSEAAFSSREKVTTFPDAVKATEHPYRRLANEKVEDELFIHNNDHPIKEEIGVESQPCSGSKPSSCARQELDEDQESNSQSKRITVQSAKVRSLSRLNSPQKNRRKRARRKARSSRWTRRSSG